MEDSSLPNPLMEKPAEFHDMTRETWRGRIRRLYKHHYPIDKDHPDLKIYHCSQFSLAKTVDGLSTASGTNLSPLQQGEPQALAATRCSLAVHQNSIWYDSDGLKLVQYFPRLLSRTAGPILSELETLVKAYTPHPPPQHSQQQQSEEEWLYNLPPENPSGFLRLTVHDNLAKDQAACSDLLSRDTIRITAANFRRSTAISDMSQYLSILLAAIDPPSWRKYRDVYIKLASQRECCFLRDWDPSNIECFIDHTILVNMSTTIDRDWKNLPEGWICMVALGEFMEGGIVLPDLGVELPFQAGDVVFMRSWALWHFLKEYQGVERYVIVLSTSNALFNWSSRL